MLDTSPAKRPPTRTRGRSSRGSTPRSTGTKSPRRRIGSTSTTGELAIATRVILTAVHPCRWDLTPDISIHIEAVHRLSNLGAVVTRESHGTSREGFDAEWRVIDF